MVFARLWLEYRIAPLEERGRQDAVYDPSALMEAEIKYLEILDDTSLWPIGQGRQNQLTQGHLLRLLGEQYFELKDFNKAKAYLVRSLEIFKNIGGHHGRTTLVSNIYYHCTSILYSLSYTELRVEQS